MKKKIIIVSVIILILAISIILCLNIKKQIELNQENKMKAEIIEKANNLYGKDECKCRSLGIAGQAISKWTCELCNKEYESPNTAVPKICYKCSIITDRCKKCAGLLGLEEE